MTSFLRFHLFPQVLDTPNLKQAVRVTIKALSVRAILSTSSDLSCSSTVVNRIGEHDHHGLRSCTRDGKWEPCQPICEYLSWWSSLAGAFTYAISTVCLVDGRIIWPTRPCFQLDSEWATWIITDDITVRFWLDIAYRLSADLNNFANQTNLAVKGIIAIKAMSELSSSLGRKVDSDTYSVSFSLS